MSDRKKSMKLTKEQLVKETASKLNRYLTTHSIFYTTIRAETAFLKQFAKSDRAKILQKITESFIRKLHSIAIKKPLSTKNRHLLIDAYCVTESLTRYKQDDDEHTHAFLCINHELEDKLVHRTIRDELDYKTVNQIIQRASFEFENQKYSFHSAIHSIKSKRVAIHFNNLFQKSLEEVEYVLDYTYKNCDAENEFYSQFEKFKLINSEITNDDIRRRTRDITSHSQNRMYQARKSNTAYARQIQI